MEEKCHRLLQPLLPSTTQNSISASSIQREYNTTNYNPEVISSNSVIVFRFGLIILIGILSIWANHEASKGHSITIINEANDTAQERRFDLFYASNDKASRLVYGTSKFVENFFYPNASYSKKQVNRVVLRLSSRSMTESVVVESPRKEEYVLYISPSVMDEINHGHAMFLAVQKGMTRIWLSDGEGEEAPSSLVNGIVEYISQLAFGSIKLPEKMEALQPDCWKNKNPEDVAEFFNYFEMKKPGFIRRLNQELRNGWHERMVEEALGMPIQHLCVPHNSSISI